MLNILICLGGLITIPIVGELLWRHKTLHGEYLRKFIHISAGVFIASWPWLISWRSIQIIGLLMTTTVLLNRYFKKLHLSGDIKRRTIGDPMFTIAIVVCALLTNQPIFFALAILHLALADGLAAIVGTALHQKYSYRVFGQIKTVFGSMTFWLVSLFIFGIGGLFAHNLIPFNDYLLMTAVLPPILTVLENLAIIGLDNIVVPVATVIALRLVA